MGNINSISKLNFEDMSKFINSKDAIIINTLETNNQSCLINGTLSPEEEINRLNLHLGQKNTKSVNVVIYGKNCSDLTIEVKYKQLIKLGFSNTSIYLGGLFEWLILQEIYGNDLFPTTSNELDILKYK